MRYYCVFAAVCAAFFCGQTAAAAPLWTIGTPDGSAAEFALAPGGYRDFRHDGFFVVGLSDPRVAWPYAHPGPRDGWAGARQHTFTIAFNLASRGNGDARLTLDLADTHADAPPKLSIDVNGTVFTLGTRAGGGDDSIFGAPERGRRSRVAVDVPGAALKAGDNSITVTTTEGSWLLYDAVTFDGPDSASLGQVESAAQLTTLQPKGTLLRRGGAAVQAVAASVAWSGQETDAVLRIGDYETALRLVPGVTTVEAAAPNVSRAGSVGCSLQIGGKTAARRELALRPVRKWTVYLLPHSHNDIGYTMPQDDVLRKQIGNIRQAMEIARATATYPRDSRFRWNAEVMWAPDTLLREAAPEERNAVRDAIRSGQLGLDGLYGNFLTAVMRPEEWFRSMDYAVAAGAFSGVPVTSAMISDVPGYTWGAVTAMAQAGVRYLSISPNQYDRIGRTFAWGDRPFWWVSPSGRERLLVWMTGTPYSLYHPGPFATMGAEPMMAQLRKLEAAGYPYDVTYFRYTIGGDNGPPDPGLSDAIRAWNETHVSPRIIIATTKEPFRELERRYGKRLPVVKGDFTPYWEDGAGSAARETAENRRSADRLVQAETLFSLRSPDAFPAEELRRAWQSVLLFSEHTWGAYNSVSEPDSEFARVQWATKRGYAESGVSASAQLLTAALAPAGTPLANTVDVWNTSSWPRTGLATAPATAAGDRVVDNAGSPVPSQRLSTGELVFLAREVPAFGFARYRVEAGAPAAPTGGAAEAGADTMRTSALQVGLDPVTGSVRSLRHARFGEVAGAGGLNSYTYLPGSDVSGARPNGPATVRVLENGPLVAALEVTSAAPGCRSLRRVYRAVEGLGVLEVTDTLDKERVRAKEGVHIGFDFGVPGGQVRMETPWATVRPDADQIEGANRNWYTAQRWVDVSNADAGVTWCTPDTPLLEVGGLTANVIGSAGDPALWMDRAIPSQTLYSWALNNHWHTNYPADQEGLITLRYALRPHGPWDPADAYRAGVEGAEPLLAVPAAGPLLPPRLEVTGPGVFVTSVAPAGPGPAPRVRLYNVTEKDVTARLRWDGSGWVRVKVPARGVVTATP